MPDPTKPQLPFWLQAPFWITLLLTPLVYIVVIVVLWPNNGFTTEIKVMVVTAVIAGLLGAITGYWLASSYGSTKKDETIAAQQSSLLNQGEQK